MEGLYRGCLFTTSEAFLIPLIALGLWFYSRSNFGGILCVFLFAMVYNTFLKGVFQVPLNPQLKQVGWAFPSGHMLSAFVFWVQLGVLIRNRLFAFFIVTLLVGIGSALVHFGYHTIWDVLGAVVLGIPPLVVAFYLHRKAKNKHCAWACGIWFLMAGIFALLIQGAIPLHVYLALGALLGVTLGFLFLGNFCFSRSMRWLIFIVSLLFLSLIFRAFAFYPPEPKVTFFKYAIVGFALNGGIVRLLQIFWAFILSFKPFLK